MTTKINLCCLINPYAVCRSCSSPVCLDCVNTSSAKRWTGESNRILICLSCNKAKGWVDAETGVPYGSKWW